MEVKPLSSVEALSSWNGAGNLKEFLDTLPKIAPRGQKKGFKTLVCHDLFNGYLDDKHCFGTQNYEAYRFYNWAGVDTFVYFSHHLVTIPPCGWVAAAHKHGVKVLGTFITEFGHGKEVWKQLLSNENLLETCINNLVRIACAYKFEGWLLNVENEIELEKIKLLIYFSEELTKRMRQNVSNSEVIWYDAVTREGKLDWQNKLNLKNKCFFDVCDGIFLNYQWNDKCLSETAERVTVDRLSDVYVGIDVFGRNFYEGGGFNSVKALKLIRHYDLSVAIFAQGWTYEELGKENFFINEGRLWQSLYPHLHFDGPTELPLITSFCQGFGKDKFHRGKIVEKGPWYDLCKQQVQPIWEDLWRSTSSLISLSLDKVFSGGSCVALWIDKFTSIRFFVCQIDMVPSMQFEFAYRHIGIKYLSFNFAFAQNNLKTKDDDQVNKTERVLRFVAEYPEYDTKTKALKDSTDETDFSIVTEEASEEDEWKIRRYFIPEGKGCLASLKVDVEGPGVLWLGQVAITQKTNELHDS